MDYKVVFVPKFGVHDSFEQEYKTKEEAKTALDAIANYTLMLHEWDYMPDWSNTGYILEKECDEWVEIDED